MRRETKEEKSCGNTSLVLQSSWFLCLWFSMLFFRFSFVAHILLRQTYFSAGFSAKNQNVHTFTFHNWKRPERTRCRERLAQRAPSFICRLQNKCLILPRRFSVVHDKRRACLLPRCFTSSRIASAPRTTARDSKRVTVVWATKIFSLKNLFSLLLEFVSPKFTCSPTSFVALSPMSFVLQLSQALKHKSRNIRKLLYATPLNVMRANWFQRKHW